MTKTNQQQESDQSFSNIQRVWKSAQNPAEIRAQEWEFRSLLWFVSGLRPGKREYAPPPWHPSSLGLSPDPEVTEQNYVFLGENKGKGIHHRGQDRRVYYTIEAQTPNKKKRRVSIVVVYTFLFLVTRHIDTKTSDLEKK